VLDGPRRLAFEITASPYNGPPEGGAGQKAAGASTVESNNVVGVEHWRELVRHGQYVGFKRLECHLLSEHDIPVHELTFGEEA
jgi:hypothetical protein